MGANRTREEWAKVIRTLERTKEAVGPFCERRGIAPKTLKWWRWHLRSKSVVARAEQEIRLIPVDVVKPQFDKVSATTIALSISDVDLRFEVGTDVAYVSDLCAALRARC